MGELDPKMAEARTRLEGLAVGLVLCSGLEPAARLIAGTFLGLLLANAGRPATVAYLEDLTAQVRDVHPEDTLEA